MKIPNFSKCRDGSSWCGQPGNNLLSPSYASMSDRGEILIYIDQFPEKVLICHHFLYQAHFGPISSFLRRSFEAQNNRETRLCKRVPGSQSAPIIVFLAPESLLVLNRTRMSVLPTGSVQKWSRSPQNRSPWNPLWTPSSARGLHSRKIDINHMLIGFSGRSKLIFLQSWSVK